jgi:hypothetical protein
MERRIYLSFSRPSAKFHIERTYQLRVCDLTLIEQIRMASRATDASYPRKFKYRENLNSSGRDFQSFDTIDGQQRDG